MLIEAGFDIVFECPAQTPMLLQLRVHPSRDADLLTPDKIACDPILATRSYIDHFGNRVTRVEVPAGLVTFSSRFVIHDSGQPEETPPDVDMTPIADLPDDVLLFLLQSRYCDSDKLADFAWSNFGMMSGGRQRVQAICDSCTQRSGSVIPMRVQPAARAIPCTKALVYAATSRISPSRSVGA
jgi:transglutaminase-like putative cysteine protease